MTRVTPDGCRSPAPALVHRVGAGTGPARPEEDTVAQYLLSMIQPVGEPPAPEALARIGTDVQAFQDELRAAGAWVFAGGLHGPETATVVRASGDEALLTDGPWIEAKEHLGGVVVLTAPDLDAALEWGRKASRATTLPVEVRPFLGG